MATREKLRAMRKSKGILPIDIAKAIGLRTESAYYKKESGVTNFTVDEAKIIADMLGSTIDDIFFNEELSQNDKTA